MKKPTSILPKGGSPARAKATTARTRSTCESKSPFRGDLEGQFTVVVVFVMMVFIGGRSWGQNLVPNGSFETNNNCPTSVSQFDYAIPWFTPTWGTTDYLNACTNSMLVDIPHNFFGYQDAYSGNAYAAFFACLVFYDSAVAVNYREYLEVRLNSPLQAGVNYYVTFYVSLADSMNYATDAVGCYFSMDTAKNDTGYFLPVTPQVENASGNFLIDKSGWTKISGHYIAQGGEQFLTIGNFKNYSITQTISVSGGSTNIGQSDWWGGYYYLDDVCVSTDSLGCYATGIEPINSQPTFSLSPNPVQNLLTMNLFSPPVAVTIVVYDAAGRKIVLPATFSNNKAELTTTTLPNGIYLLQIINNKTGMSQVSKFVKEE